MKLKVGKRYRRRDGQETAITGIDSAWASYPFIGVCTVGGRPINYAEDGIAALYSVKLSPFDLVEEVVEETAEKAVEQAPPEADPNGIDAHTPGAKLDAGKPRVWLCVGGFSRALEAVARVTTVGAGKYSPNGWKQVDGGAERYMEAFGRHMLELGQGKIVDSGPGGTGCLHKAQMIWNLLASLELELEQWDVS